MTAMAGIRGWWDSLSEDPPPLEAGQKLAAWIVTIAVGLTRPLACALTPWDWDEELFISALRHYDVTAHHPHPPGFPLFIATAKLFTFLGLSEFHALQAISLLASVAIVPAMLFLGRELRAGFVTSLVGAVFLAFFPNVWIFGGTAFSDVPSMTIVVLAVALLLRGCRSDAALYGGAIVLAVAVGYRPQNLSLGFAPSMIAAARAIPRRWVQLAAAAAIGAAIVAISYGLAAHLSGGWVPYREAVELHQKYIANIDSFRSPIRPPLTHLIDDFFVRPYRVPVVNAFVTLLLAIGGIAAIARVRVPALVMLAAFGPFCIVAWLVLDRFSVSRFSIGYAPLVAFLAADGLHLLTSRAPRLERAIAIAFALGVTIWIWPALREVRRNPSPPFTAAEWIRRHTDPSRSTLYVHSSMEPMVKALLPGYPYVPTGDSAPAVTGTTREGDLFLIEEASNDRAATVFRRPHGRLAALVRDRYFEVSILPVQGIITFTGGWYDEERQGDASWRWMGSQGRCLLPPLAGRGLLTFAMYVPLDALETPPTIEVRINGAVADRFVATTSNVERSIEVTSRIGEPNELVFSTDRVVNPAAAGLGGDTRDLGLRLMQIAWTRANREGRSE